MKHKTKLLVAALCSLAYASAFAQTPDWIIESRAGGLHPSDYSTTGGWANSSGSTTAPGTTPAIGSVYSGTSLYFGPTRSAVFAYTPTVSGSYQIDMAWASSAGEYDTSVNLFTGAASGGPNDAWGNAGPVGVIFAGQMDMYYNSTATWNTFTTAALTGGTTYYVSVYGGHVAVAPENRVHIAAAGFTMVPEPSSIALGLIGGLGIMAWINRRRTA